jgi:hypothetical protein
MAHLADWHRFAAAGMRVCVAVGCVSSLMFVSIRDTKTRNWQGHTIYILSVLKLLLCVPYLQVCAITAAAAKASVSCHRLLNM